MTRGALQDLAGEVGHGEGLVEPLEGPGLDVVA